jgi:hypothetical protein
MVPFDGCCSIDQVTASPSGSTAVQRPDMVWSATVSTVGLADGGLFTAVIATVRPARTGVVKLATANATLTDGKGFRRFAPDG